MRSTFSSLLLTPESIIIVSPFGKTMRVQSPVLAALVVSVRSGARMYILPSPPASRAARTEAMIWS